MLYHAKIWVSGVRWVEKENGLFPERSVFRDFLLTMGEDPALLEFLKALPRPVYALIPDDGVQAESQLKVALSSLKKEVGGRVILIPLVHKQKDTIKVMYRGPKAEQLRDHLRIEQAVLLSPEHPNGFVDPELVEDPLTLLKEGFATFYRKKVASELDMMNALWRMSPIHRIVNYTRLLKAKE